MNTVKYNLKNVNCKETIIFLIFRFDKQTLKVSTKLRIKPKYWNFTSQRVKKGIKNSRLINDLLDTFEVKLSKILLEKRLTDTTYTVDDIKCELFGRTNKTLMTSSLLGYMRSIITIKRPIWSRSTFNSYNRSHEILSEFIETTDTKDNFDAVDLKFYNSLLHFLYSEPRNYSINNAGKIIQNLKAILNSAVSEGICTNLKFKHRNFKKPNQVTSNIYLTLDEINDIRRVNLTNNKYSKVRDILIFLCYTGLRFSDVYRLTKDSVRIISNINEPVKVLEVLTKKTGSLVSIPLHPFVVEILDKYNYELPKYSNQKFNRYIKEVARIAGINKMVSITTSISGLPVLLTKPKFEFVCSHIGRRTMITNMYLSKIDSHSIRMISGHTSEKEFMKYIRVSKEQNSVTLSKHPFFKI